MILRACYRPTWLVGTLIQWAGVQAIDVETERVVLDKLLTFRGDTDEAWDRAEVFLARELTALAPAP